MEEEKFQQLTSARTASPKLKIPLLNYVTFEIHIAS